MRASRHKLATTPCGSSSRGQTLVERSNGATPPNTAAGSIWRNPRSAPYHASASTASSSTNKPSPTKSAPQVVGARNREPPLFSSAGCLGPCGTRASVQGLWSTQKSAITTCTRLRAGSVYGVVLCPVVLFCRYKGVNGEDIAVPLVVSVKATQVWIGLRRKKRAARQSVGIIVGIVNYRLKKYVIKTCR